MTQPRNAADFLQIGPLDVPVSLAPAARRLLGTPAGIVARQVVRMVVRAKREGLPVALLEVKAASDPEIENWHELIVRVSLMCREDVAMQAWLELSARLDEVRASLDTFQREVMDEGVAFQVAWQDG